MTLQELYANIGGDFEQATRVLRMEKLIDKHIRKFAGNGIIDSLIAAGKSMDPTVLFETSHAVKGVCSNLGLTRIAELASQISEEYRPGNSRTMSDEQVNGILAEIETLYQKVVAGINQYVAG